MKTIIDIATTPPSDINKILDGIIPEYKKVKAVLIYNDGTITTRRIGRANEGGYIVMFPRSPKFGGRLSQFILYGVRTLEVYHTSDKTQEVIWRESWEKTLKYLDASGLWSDIANNIRTALDIGFEKMTAANTLYWKQDYASRYSVEYLQKFYDIDPRLLSTNNDGAYPNTELIWYMSKVARITSMYFGKRYNHPAKKAEIKTALKDKLPLNLWGQASYDVTYTYKPEANKAWYSEEFRGCGNGHYYLALDDTHALFYEDD